MDQDIDMIDICNPTHLHPETAIKALHAGKHVLVEKAIALDPQDADAMLEAARKANRLLMVAHVLPFFPEFAYAAQAIRSGQYGKLLAGHFKRVIARPDWSAEIGDAAKTGGPAIDLHIHDTHFIGLVCGVPNQVFSTGVVGTGGSGLFDDGLSIRSRRSGGYLFQRGVGHERAGRSCTATKSIWRRRRWSTNRELAR